MVRTYHYGDTTQISPHFKASEFQCKCGKPHDFQVSDELVQNLEKLRNVLQCKSIHVSSGFRCPEHDVAVGGKGTGKHTQGLAADIICYNSEGIMISSKYVCCKAQDIGFRGIANINQAYTSTHLDMRLKGKWYGNEITGNDTVTDDFYAYYNIKKEGEPMSTEKKGIDISYCQQKIDWNKVTADFVIARAGYGRYTHQKDAMFESHYSGAKSRGIPIGAYWYSYAMTEEDARREADACIEVLKGKQFEYPIYYDVEEKDQFDLGKGKVSAIIRAFLERLEAAGYWVGLYGSYSSLTTFTDEDIRKRYAIWLAHWDVKKSPYSGAYGVWQYGVGKADGVTGDCDLDYSYVDYPAKIKEKGLNGYGKPPEEPKKKEITVEMTVDGTTYSGTLYEI